MLRKSFLIHSCVRIPQGSYDSLSPSDYFIDPWDTAYWVRDRCNEDTGERVVFVYSMGPNRRGDSSRWRIRGDDIGVYVIGGPEQRASRDE